MKKLYVYSIISFIALALTSNRVESDTSTVPYYIYNSATQFNIDIALMYSICTVESNCRSKAINHDDATPAKKALGHVEKSYGLFQIKAATAKGLGFQQYETIVIFKKKHGKLKKYTKIIDHTKDLLKPEINSWYAAKLLRQLYKRYNNTPKVISAYNAGHYTKANKEYVHKVLINYARYKIDKKL